MGKSSMVWKFIGPLSFKNKRIFPNKNFCKICLEGENFYIKP